MRISKRIRRRIARLARRAKRKHLRADPLQNVMRQVYGRTFRQGQALLMLDGKVVGSIVNIKPATDNPSEAITTIQLEHPVDFTVGKFQMSVGRMVDLRGSSEALESTLTHFAQGGTTDELVNRNVEDSRTIEAVVRAIEEGRAHITHVENNYGGNGVTSIDLTHTLKATRIESNE